METAHIYIYGEIGHTQEEFLEEFGVVNLSNVRDQFNKQKKAKSITAHIHSNGGSVAEGFAIHDFLRAQGVPVTTIIEGMCYSIATVIALAGDTRKMTENSDFMIHNPTGGVQGDSKTTRKYADQMEQLENKCADFYASKTKITREQALVDMDAETFFTAEQALEKGFITEIVPTMKAVARLDIKKKTTKNKNKMANKGKKNKLEKMVSNFGKEISKILGEDPKNIELTTADADVVLVFPDLEEGQTAAVGDTATVDGAPAEGDHLMPDGTTFVFEAGAVTEIKDAAEETDEQVEQLEADLTEAKAKIKKFKARAKTAEAALEKLGKEFKAIESLAGDYVPKGTKGDKGASAKGGGKKRTAARHM